jgi:Flp pilus assembly protein TadB
MSTQWEQKQTQKQTQKQEQKQEQKQKQEQEQALKGISSADINRRSRRSSADSSPRGHPLRRSITQTLLAVVVVEVVVMVAAAAAGVVGVARIALLRRELIFRY